jgi:fatty-acyl-CoA synthase
VRHALPGDYATVEADGSIKLLGRGNLVINSGGEKIFVEEVEEALKKHAAVRDALVFGVADAVWGQAVTAVVEASGVSMEDLREFLARDLARYKLPKRILFVEQVPRGPTGKANYAAAMELTKGEQG